MICNNCNCPFSTLHGKGDPISDPDLECMLQDASQNVSFEQGNIIFLQGQPSTSLYSLADGLVKICSNSADGREQIVGISTPGKLLLGLQSMDEETYAYSAIAATAVHGCKINQRSLLALSKTKGDLAMRLVSALNAQLAHSRALMEVMGHKSASAKIASFILLMTANAKKGNGRFALPLSRREMAALFGLTEETVCRLMADMNRTGAIYAPRGRVEILDLDQLHAIANGRSGEQHVA